MDCPAGNDALELLRFCFPPSIARSLDGGNVSPADLAVAGAESVPVNGEPSRRTLEVHRTVCVLAGSEV